MKLQQHKNLSSICDALISQAADHQLAAGPLRYQPSDGTKSKLWYFVVGCCDESEQFHSDLIYVEDEAERTAILNLLMRRPPLVLHTFDDEIDFAKWCEMLWPGERVTRLRKAVEKELVAGVKPSPAERRQLADDEAG